jgi:hypothetical protein
MSDLHIALILITKYHTDKLALQRRIGVLLPGEAVTLML